MMELARRFIFMLVLLIVAVGVKAIAYYPHGPATPFDLSVLAPSLILVLLYALAGAALAASIRKPTLAVVLIFVAAIWPVDTAPDYAFGCTIAALCIAGYLLERDHPGLAAVALTPTLLEPQVCAAAFVAMLFLVPRSRIVLVVAFIVVKLASVSIFGFSRYFGYFAGATPLNADADVSAPASLPHVLAAIGVQPQTAVLFGWIWFACMLLIGIAVAARAARVTELPPVSILLPVAAAMLGSPDLSSTHVVAVLPAAIVLAPDSWTARFAIALLVVRWNGTLRPEMIPAILGGIGTAFLAFARDEVRERVVWLVFAPLLSLAALALFMRFNVSTQVAIASLWIGIALLLFVRARRADPFRLSRLD